MTGIKGQDFREPIKLLHACEAVMIPQGITIDLEKGTEVFITQALGGRRVLG